MRVEQKRVLKIELFLSLYLKEGFLITIGFGVAPKTGEDFDDMGKRFNSRWRIRTLEYFNIFKQLLSNYWINESVIYRLCPKSTLLFGESTISFMAITSWHPFDRYIA
ncbi:MAG: hypothetical protein ACI9V8_001207 [Urechidicola sp.]|jgi:hypothetical protein